MAARSIDPKFWPPGEMQRARRKRYDAERDCRAGLKVRRPDFRLEKGFSASRGTRTRGRRKFRIRVYRGWIRLRAGRRGAGDAAGTYGIHQYKQTADGICRNSWNSNSVSWIICRGPLSPYRVVEFLQIVHRAGDSKAQTEMSNRVASWCSYDQLCRKCGGLRV